MFPYVGVASIMCLVASTVGLPIDAVPDVTSNQVQINAVAPAFTPQEMEQYVTFPIEVAMSSLPYKEEVRSISQFGLSQVTVVFGDETDIYRARQAEHTIGRPYATALAAAVMVMVCGAMFPFLGAEFSPKLDEGALAISLVRLPSVSLDEAVRITIDAERVVKAFPEVDKVVSRIGRPEIATDPMGPNMGDTYVFLKPREQWVHHDLGRSLGASRERTQSPRSPVSDSCRWPCRRARVRKCSGPWRRW